MSYRYRWIYMGCIMLMMLALGYYADLKGLMQYHAALVSSEVAIKSEAEVRSLSAVLLPKKINLRDDVVTSSKKLAALSGLLNENNIELLSIVRADQASGDSLGGEFIQLVLSGQYANLHRLLEGLAAQGDAVTIRDFSFIPGTGQRIHAEFSMAMRENGVRKETFHSILETQRVNPFCGASKSNDVMQEPLQHFILAEVRLLGSVLRREQWYAVIMLPDGVVQEVNVGMLLGGEGGRVEKIEESTVTVLLPDQSRHVMRLSLRA